MQVLLCLSKCFNTVSRFVFPLKSLFSSPSSLLYDDYSLKRSATFFSFDNGPDILDILALEQHALSQQRGQNFHECCTSFFGNYNLQLVDLNTVWVSTRDSK